MTNSTPAELISLLSLGFYMLSSKFWGWEMNKEDDGVTEANRDQP
jgi:hypothetical protein